MQVTEDALLGGRVRLRQPADGYRAAIDPVFLAAAVPAQDGQVVLDAGVGVGAAALCVAARVPTCRVVGIEIQPALAAMARENVQLNGMQGRVDVLTGNMAAPPPRLAPGSYHHVMTNPPFLTSDQASAPPNASKSTANVEGEADLQQWIRFCVNMLRPKGTLIVIHRADRLDDLLAALRGKVGEISLFPLWPKHGRSAKRVILRARKAVASPLEILPGMVLHEDDGNYTDAAQQVLWNGAGLW
jgi:tRNA1(Val) A37 N6-methylase TrmN6